MTDNKEMLVPQIRFKGYANAWGQRAWVDTVDISTKMVDPRTGRYDELPHVGTGNIESNTGQLLDNIRTVKEDNLTSGKFHFQSGDIIYGKIRPNLAKYFHSDFEGLCSADAYVLNSKNGLEQCFLFMLLQCKEFYDYSVSVSQRTKMPKINRNELNQFMFNAPCPKEQTTIGNFFRTLDNALIIQKRKCESLRKLKAAYLQQMFPQNGESVPRVRFSGFSDNWNEKKLSEVLLERNIQQLPSETIPLVSFTVESGVTPKSNRYNREFLVKEEQKKYKYTKTDDIVYNPANLKFGAIARNKYGDAVFSPIYVTFEVNDIALPSFIEMVVTDQDFIKRSLVFQEGTVYERMAVKPEDFLSLSICLPSLEEQAIIGKFFNNLDVQIIAMQTKLDKLKQLKQAYLQKMFV